MMEVSRGPVREHLIAQNGREKRFGVLAGAGGHSVGAGKHSKTLPAAVLN